MTLPLVKTTLPLVKTTLPLVKTTPPLVKTTLPLAQRAHLFDICTDRRLVRARGVSGDPLLFLSMCFHMRCLRVVFAQTLDVPRLHSAVQGTACWLVCL